MKNSAVLVKSLLVIAITVGVAGFALTQSLFRDTERSDRSTFVVGTLDMSVDGHNGTSAESIVVTNVGANTSLSGGKTWVIRNIGTLPGKLRMRLANIVGNENGCTEPEAEADTTCDNPGLNQGELGQALAITVSLFHNSQEQTIATGTLAPTDQQQYELQWDENAGVVTIPPDGSAEVTIRWELISTQLQNELQSDDVSFDVIFDLQQLVL